MGKVNNEYSNTTFELLYNTVISSPVLAFETTLTIRIGEYVSYNIFVQPLPNPTTDLQ
jgi:hypothetical protein